jgi:hypothetical protein
MSSIDIQTTLLQADWRACLAALSERARKSSTSWKSVLWRTMRRFEEPSSPDAVGIVLGPATMRFDAAGIGVRQGLLHVVHDWAAVREGTATPDHMFLWLDKSLVIIVPVRSLPAGLPLTEFQSRLDAMHDAAARRPVPAAKSAVPARREPAARMAAAASLADS